VPGFSVTVVSVPEYVIMLPKAVRGIRDVSTAPHAIADATKIFRLVTEFGFMVISP
jgi:hypothetical protein